MIRLNEGQDIRKKATLHCLVSVVGWTTDGGWSSSVSKLRDGGWEFCLVFFFTDGGWLRCRQHGKRRGMEFLTIRFSDRRRMELARQVYSANAIPIQAVTEIVWNIFQNRTCQEHVLEHVPKHVLEHVPEHV